MSAETTQDYVRANDESRARLRALVGSLDRGQLTRRAMEGWTVSAVLAHLGFWDRFTVRRWHTRLAGIDVPALAVLDDLINESALPMWNAVPPEAAAREALAAAEDADAFVAALGRDVTARWLAEGRPRSLYRSEHRSEHLDDIERALAR